MFVHLATYFILVFTLLPPVHAALFITLNQALMGLYIGCTFAPNHKGMDLITGAVPANFLRRQATTSRNVRPSPVNDCFYAGSITRSNTTCF